MAGKVKELLEGGIKYLQGMGITEAMIDAEALLAFSLGISREKLIANFGLEAGAEAADRFKNLMERRARGEPLAYITGAKEFWSLEFEVDRAVLIPRPETEFVVEEALAIARSALDSTPRILDIGTGCGNIAISLAKELGQSVIVAIDVSEEALALARRNALRHSVAARADFRRLDLFDLPASYDAFFDIIVSNPPYISAADIESLPSTVKNFEPMVALCGGEDGLHFIRGILRAGLKILRPDRFLVIEIGFGQKQAVENCVRDFGAYRILKIVKDYAGIDRVLVGQMNG